MTYLDEVHAVGMYGPRGAGVAERDGRGGRDRHRRGHARQGVRRHGRLHRRRRGIVDAIRSHATGFIFTTALPPAWPAGRWPHAAAEGPSGWRSAAPPGAGGDPEGAAAQRRPAGDAPPVHIVPVLVGDPVRCKVAPTSPRTARIYVQPINYPTVPRGTERLRFTPAGCTTTG